MAEHGNAVLASGNYKDFDPDRLSPTRMFDPPELWDPTERAPLQLPAASTLKQHVAGGGAYYSTGHAQYMTPRDAVTRRVLPLGKSGPNALGQRTAMEGLLLLKGGAEGLMLDWHFAQSLPGTAYAENSIDAEAGLLARLHPEKARQSELTWFSLAPPPMPLLEHGAPLLMPYAASRAGWPLPEGLVRENILDRALLGISEMHDRPDVPALARRLRHSFDTGCVLRHRGPPGIRHRERHLHQGRERRAGLLHPRRDGHGGERLCDVRARLPHV